MTDDSHLNSKVLNGVKKVAEMKQKENLPQKASALAENVRCHLRWWMPG